MSWSIFCLVKFIALAFIPRYVRPDDYRSMDFPKGYALTGLGDWIIILCAPLIHCPKGSWKRCQGSIYPGGHWYRKQRGRFWPGIRRRNQGILPKNGRMLNLKGKEEKPLSFGDFITGGIIPEFKNFHCFSQEGKGHFYFFPRDGWQSFLLV